MFQIIFYKDYKWHLVDHLEVSKTSGGSIGILNPFGIRKSRNLRKL